MTNNNALTKVSFSSTKVIDSLSEYESKLKIEETKAIETLNIPPKSSFEYNQQFMLD